VEVAQLLVSSNLLSAGSLASITRLTPTDGSSHLVLDVPPESPHGTAAAPSAYHHQMVSRQLPSTRLQAPDAAGKRRMSPQLPPRLDVSSTTSEVSGVTVPPAASDHLPSGARGQQAVTAVPHHHHHTVQAQQGGAVRTLDLSAGNKGRVISCISHAMQLHPNHQHHSQMLAAHSAQLLVSNPSYGANLQQRASGAAAVMPLQLHSFGMPLTATGAPMVMMFNAAAQPLPPNPVDGAGMLLMAHHQLVAEGAGAAP
jgi:hypothetical protein